MDSFGHTEHRAGRFGLAALAALLLAAALGVRLWTAWALRHSTDPNLAVNGIMTKQIADGTGFPPFFLGQEQVGTVEFFVAAPVCRLLGCNGFTMNFGVVLFGVAIVGVAFFWARHLAGPAAGLTATALLVVGPEHFLRYTGGMGYAAITFTNAMVLALTGPLLERFRRSGSLRAWEFAVLGFFAGLGWWSSPMVVFSLATAGLTLILFLRWRAFHWRVWTGGLLGFAVGAAPWLAWNAAHGFASLKVGSSFDKTLFISNLAIFFKDTLYPLLGVRVLPTPVGLALAIGIGALCLVVPLLLAKGCARKQGPWQARLPSLTVLALALPVTATIYSLTKYGADATPRYLLPLVPPGVVAIATAIALLGRRWRPAWILLPLLILAQLPALKQYPSKARKYAAIHARTLELAAFLHQQRIDGLYGPYLERGLNFELHEEFVFWPANGLRLEPYWNRIERGSRPAVLDQNGAVNRFLARTDGAATYAAVAGHELYYDFEPPSDGLTEIPPEDILSIRNNRGADLKPILNDGMLAPCWPGDSEGWLEIRLAKPVALRAIRLEGGTRGAPALQVETKRAGQTEWQPLGAAMIPTDFSWWGPRPYWRGTFRRAEFRVRAESTDAFRLRFSKDKPWDLAELRLFTSGGPAPDPVPALASLRSRLDQQPPALLYCDRWAGSQLRGTEPYRIVTESYVRDASDPPFDPTIELVPGLALLVAAEDVAMTRAALAKAHVRMAETPMGPWTLFTFGPGDWREAYAGVRALHWTGSGVLVAGARSLSLALTRVAEALSAANAAEAEQLHREALRAFPANPPAAERLAALLRDTGRVAEAETIAQSYQRLWTPDLPAPVNFRGGLALLGLSVAPRPLQRGESFLLKSYWRCPPDFPAADVAAFVHFHSDNARFQADHDLEFPGLEEQPFPWTFVLENSFAVPAGVPPGSYQIEIGAFNPRTGKRLAPQTELPARRKAVCLAARVEVR